ncbi:putative Ig domain-containing protein [Undibacterium sp. TJN19]
MNKNRTLTISTTPSHWLAFTSSSVLLAILCTAASVLLSACGGSTEKSASLQTPAAVPALIATGTTTFEVTVPVLPPDAGATTVLPTFHLAPVLLDAPADIDAIDNKRSARMQANRQTIPRELQGMRSRGLTVAAIQAVPRQNLAPAPVDTATQTGQNAQPLASSGSVSTYTPAQIRTAYGLPTLPSNATNTASLTAAQAAQLGAGQTIYIIDAMHDPNLLAELTAFNQKFGLPGCATKTIASTASLPLAAAAMTGCEIAVVYSSTSGTMTSSAPAYDSGWATEITLDVQWSHATAPLARIILIEAPDASMNNLVAAIKLANAMGPGVVSMSFGSHEGSWTSTVESAFTTAKMTYVASTGDSGAGVDWPSVSPNVIGVGGTTLSYSGTGARSEVAWASTGGGVSSYTATPAYQSNAVPGLGTPGHRVVADVAFNADPNSGQYVAVIKSGSSTVNWVSAGGTSLAAPQWAGIFAVANAVLAQNSKPVLAAPHSVLYGKIATVPGTYANVFADVTKGTDGSCTNCSAKTGFDPLTGLGTPNVNSLLSTISGMDITSPPVVNSASISGVAGTALSFTVSASSSNALSYSLSGAPPGMIISSAGIVNWAAPVSGTYAVTVTATDSKTGLSAKGIYTVNIVAVAAPVAPVVSPATISGKAGSTLSFNINAVASNTLIYSLIGAPTGMTVSSNGVVNWPSPVTGNYAVTAIAKDSKTGLSGQAVYSVNITASGSTSSTGPVITTTAMTGVAGKALSGAIGITDAGVSSVSVSVSGAPLGMNFSMSGLNISINWPSPVTGTYTLKISVTDSAGKSAQASVPVTITAK